MKKTVFILFFFLIGFQSITFGQEKNQIDENGFKQGKWVIDNSIKKLPDYTYTAIVEEGNYINNRKEGVWITYYPDGSKKNEITYKRNMPSGPAKFYYENGVVSEEGTWVNNKWNGSYKYAYKNGNPMYQFNYVDGQREGVQKYFHENGALKIEGTWNQGREEGVLKTYDDKGNIVSEKVFELGTYNKEKSKIYKVEDENKKEEPIILKPREVLPNAKEITVVENKDKQLEVVLRKEEGVESLGFFNGEGNHILKNKNGQVQSEGFFKSGKLMDGKEYVYNGFQLTKTIHFKKGKITKIIENTSQ